MVVWEATLSSFKKRVFCGKINNNENIIEPKLFLNKCIFILLEKVGEFIYKFKSPVKINCELCCEYLLQKNNNLQSYQIYHNSRMMPIILNDDFTEWFNVNVMDPILNNMSEFQERDSGKALNKICFLQVSKKTSKYFLN